MLPKPSKGKKYQIIVAVFRFHFIYSLGSIKLQNRVTVYICSVDIKFLVLVEPTNPYPQDNLGKSIISYVLTVNYIRLYNQNGFQCYCEGVGAASNFTLEAKYIIMFFTTQQNRTCLFKEMNFSLNTYSQKYLPHFRSVTTVILNYTFYKRYFAQYSGGTLISIMRLVSQFYNEVRLKLLVEYFSRFKLIY